MRAANREWPPISKKLSVTPMPCRPKASCQMASIFSSAGVCGHSTSSAVLPRVQSGSGSAFLSILRLGVSGNSAMTV